MSLGASFLCPPPSWATRSTTWASSSKWASTLHHEILLDDHGSNCEVIFVLLLFQFCGVIHIICLVCSLQCYQHLCFPCFVVSTMQCCPHLCYLNFFLQNCSVTRICQKENCFTQGQMIDGLHELQATLEILWIEFWLILHKSKYYNFNVLGKLVQGRTVLQVPRDAPR